MLVLKLIAKSDSKIFVSLFAWMLLLMQPEVVEKLVSLREGIPRKDAKEVTRYSQLYLFRVVCTITHMIKIYLVHIYLNLYVIFIELNSNELAMATLWNRLFRSAKKYMKILLLMESLPEEASFSLKWRLCKLPKGAYGENSLSSSNKKKIKK